VPAFAVASEPAWSPDGRQIAFVGSSRVRGPKPGAIYLMNADGGGVRRLTPLMPAPNSPTWSPGGKQIAFGLPADRGGGIFIVNRDGSGLHQVAKHGHAPAWGPGGRKIAFVRDGVIRAMDTDGSRPELVASPDYLHTYQSPVWSPDGQRLAFTVDHAQDSVQPRYLGVVSRYRGPVKAVLSGEARSPDWSPDGGTIIFNRSGGFNDPAASLHVLHLGTHRTTRLRHGYQADWSPDGRRIVYADGSGGAGPEATWRIYVMNADGSSIRQLT